MDALKKLGIVVSTMSLSCVLANTALAHDAGDILLRVGAATVFTNTDSTAVTGLPDGVNNARVDVDDNTQVGITAAYMFTENLGLELLAATPFSHSVTGEGDIAGVDVGKTKHLPPTLTAQYYFGGKDSTFNPYVGVGVNYTVFFDEEVGQDLINTVNTLPSIIELGGVHSMDMSLDSSLGLAAEVGIDVKVAENWYINAALWYIDLSTTATLKTDLGTTHKVDIDLDPIVLNVAIAYKF